MMSLNRFLILYVIIANCSNNRIKSYGMKGNSNEINGNSQNSDRNSGIQIKSQSDWGDDDSILANQIDDFDDSVHRVKRGLFWDFIQKAFITKNLIVDQYRDTTNTLNDVYNILTQQFSDTATEISSITPTGNPKENLIEGEGTQSSASAATTTTEKPPLSRREFGRILGRNYRGLKRLLDLEINDALNQSNANINDYRREADQQFANSLPLEKKKLIKSYIG